MKLYLSSYRLGKNSLALLNGAATGDKVVVIQNAQDCWTDSSKRQSVFNRECTDLESLGLSPVELDLRRFFGRREDLEREIERFAYCWVCGGNSFVLRRAFYLSGFDEILWKLARQDGGLTYGGYSAGACVMTRRWKASIFRMIPPRIQTAM